MKIVADLPSPLTALDRPNSYIGRAVPRPNLQRLTQGRAQYVSDLVLPRIMAGERLTGQDLTTLGEGGLCLNCEVCTYPNCGFGK